MSKIKPKLLKGFRDLMPDEAIIKERFLKTIKKEFEKYGFSPIYTPALEYLNILTGKGGDENEKLMYKFKDNGNRDVGLRYDLTVPLARFVSLHKNDLNMPFKRYHIAPVWRAENPQKGRFREFYQCDCDIVGSNSPLSDSEIIFLIHDTLKALNIDDFQIRINSRVFVDELFKALNLDNDRSKELAILMDKKDKMSNEKFQEKYSEILDNNQKEIFEHYIYGINDFNDMENFVLKYSHSEESKKNIEHFKKVLEITESVKSHIKYDPNIIRGLDYYTGIVFETILKESPQYGAIFSGGRYDGLVGMFSNEDIPAVGASIGISRLISALEERGFFKNTGSTVSDIIIMNMSQNLEPEYIKIAHKLRTEGINTDIYYENAKMKKQFKFAQKMGYKIAIIMGEDEKNKNVVKVKDLDKFEEIECSLEDAIDNAKKILNK